MRKNLENNNFGTILLVYSTLTLFLSYFVHFTIKQGTLVIVCQIQNPPAGSFYIQLSNPFISIYYSLYDQCPEVQFLVLHWGMPPARASGCRTDPPGNAAWRAATKFRRHTAKTQHRKFETNISRKGIARPHSSNFHIYASVSDFFIPTIDLPILLQENMWTYPGNI
jgi:hypothetical protein